ncbi:hypothetical protein L1887_60021 [Cichorium endivia]|nr:hypothetical protein L1887_60021 [Cichorium endivia]
MLGREITPFHLDTDDRSDGERQAKSRAEPNPDDGDDEMMQVEDEDVTVSRAPSTPVMGPPLSLANTPSTPPHTHAVFRHSTASSALARASASDSGHDSPSSASGATSALGALGASTSSMTRAVPQSPSTGPSMGSPLGHGNRSRSSSLLSSNVVRKAVTRRGNLLPRDRSVLRVAASLQDESKPEDSEIASEAKLQKRLGGEATLPRTPRFGPSGSAAFGGSGTRVPKSPSDAPAAPGFGTGSSRRKYMWDDDVDDIRGVFCADGLDDDSSDLSEDEEEMMMYYSRTASVSDDDEAPRPGATPIRDADAAGDAAMGDASAEAGAGAGASTSVGTAVSSSLPKRKGNALWMGFRDKSNVHKWSPSTPASDRTWRRAEDTSPRVLNTGTRLSKRKTEDRYEPYKRRAVSPMNLGTSYTSAQAGAGAGSNSPLMMPISSPSGLVYRGIHQAQLAYARYSTSPTISRPCTPVGGNAAAGAAGAVAMGGFSPAASGSGPGYGSGALGLSISANNANVDARAGEELDAVMDQRVGMLGPLLVSLHHHVRVQTRSGALSVGICICTLGFFMHNVTQSVEWVRAKNRESIGRIIKASGVCRKCPVNDPACFASLWPLGISKVPTHPSLRTCPFCRSIASFTLDLLRSDRRVFMHCIYRHGLAGEPTAWRLAPAP